MRKPENNMNIAALLAAALALAACGKAELPAATEAAGRPVEMAAVEDTAETNHETIVEHRHFAIYKTYRVLFDDSSDAFQLPPQARNDGVEHAILRTGDSISACSMHAALHED